MVYVCEFEFWASPGGNVIAEPLSLDREGTFGTSLDDAVESAADWLSMYLDDCLMRGEQPQRVSFGHALRHGGRVIAVAVSRTLGDIPAITAADAARELGVTRGRVTQLCNEGKLESWRDGTKRMVSRASVESRKED
ncbi:MAG: DNA-binding protein [Coriobacteriaceae bacterium]|nr:MAG: DNA-binding protein [Coriobacteriaceae bacterium]